MQSYNNINVSTEVNHIWNIANVLRGKYAHQDFKNVIIPMTIIRRLECALAPTKDTVIAFVNGYGKDVPEKLIHIYAKNKYYYNTSEFDLEKLLNDPEHIVENFKEYLSKFSKIVRDMLSKFKFENEIEKMAEGDKLYRVIQLYAELDLSPETVDSIRMGYIFEDLIRRFSENAIAGDHFTGKDLIALTTDIILAEGMDDYIKTTKRSAILDQACGTGGMLMTTLQRLLEINPEAQVDVYGQEINDESMAICVAEMLIRELDPENIQCVDTMKIDCFPQQKFQIIHENPPFGQRWCGKEASAGVEEAVRAEHAKGMNGRFGIALPSDDMQLLFFMSAIDKLASDGRAVIYSSGTPLFKGNIGSGDSKIREYMFKNDLVDCILQLPENLFYNTGIATYVWVLSKNKSEHRVGKVQLIDASQYCHKLAKALGDKSNEITAEDRAEIVKLYKDFAENDNSKILPNEEFLVRQYTVTQPKQRRYSIDTDLLIQSGKLSNLYNPAKVAELESKLDEGELSVKDQKTLAKYMANESVYNNILKTLEKAEKVTFTNPDDMANHLKKLLNDTSLKPADYKNIAEGMSVMDKTAPIQKDKKGNVIYDKSTNETEILKGYDDLDTYMTNEVLPYTPDAHWDTEPDKTGAEVAFNRYFYKYEKPRSTDEIKEEIKALKAELAKLEAELGI